LADQSSLSQRPVGLQPLVERAHAQVRVQLARRQAQRPVRARLDLAVHARRGLGFQHARRLVAESLAEQVVGDAFALRVGAADACVGGVDELVHERANSRVVRVACGSGSARSASGRRADGMGGTSGPAISGRRRARAADSA